MPTTLWRPMLRVVPQPLVLVAPCAPRASSGFVTQVLVVRELPVIGATV
jgi:hypothetical protein